MATNPMNSLNAKVIQPLLKTLPEKQREVLLGRFGLGKSGEYETLEAIGKRFGITLERVRQIEASALDTIGETAKAHPLVQDLFRQGKKHLKDLGGVAPKDALLDRLHKSWNDAGENHLSVLLASTDVFGEHDGDGETLPHYYIDTAALKKAKGFVAQWVSHLRSEKAKVLSGGYRAEFKEFLKSKKIPTQHAESYVAVSRKIHCNTFNDIGLAEWPEVNPKTVRDRIYAVLRKQKEPVHFEEIAQLINGAKFDTRLALASTVHNELIKDSRFVLVGRGMYGLSEHGHVPGTAKEVIQRILKKHGPLNSQSIVSAVQKERLFKQNTILVNLQNRSLFARRNDGTYQVREA